MDLLLSLLVGGSPSAVPLASLGALGGYNDDRIADTVLTRFKSLSPALQARAIELLCGRPAWAIKLVMAVDGGRLPATAVSRDQVRRLRGLSDGGLVKLVEKTWGKGRASTPFETQGRINAVLQLLSKRTGDASRGRVYFEKTCASCHKLRGVGSSIGPDLTGAERKNREILIQNIVDPSAVIRQEFMTHIALTKDGQVLTGLLAESTPQTIALVDAKNQRTVLKRSDLEELKESPLSLMPEKLLDDLRDQEICDLVAYLQQEDNAAPAR